MPMSSEAPRKAAVKLETSDEKSDIEKRDGEKPAAATASEETEKQGYEYRMNIEPKMNNPNNL